MVEVEDQILPSWDFCFDWFCFALLTRLQKLQSAYNSNNTCRTNMQHSRLHFQRILLRKFSTDVLSNDAFNTITRCSEELRIRVVLKTFYQPCWCTHHVWTENDDIFPLLSVLCLNKRGGCENLNVCSSIFLFALHQPIAVESVLAISQCPGPYR